MLLYFEIFYNYTRKINDLTKLIIFIILTLRQTWFITRQSLPIGEKKKKKLKLSGGCIWSNVNPIKIIQMKTPERQHDEND